MWIGTPLLRRKLRLLTTPSLCYCVSICFRIVSRLFHERAVKRICKYCLSFKNEGVIFKPDISKSLECHVDADFAGGWATGDGSWPQTVLSRTGYIISYAGFPIYWARKLQPDIELSTTEAEYISLSMTMRGVHTAIFYIFSCLSRKCFFLHRRTSPSCFLHNVGRQQELH